ncbi:MAG: DMT family transporter [Bacteroidales bacterium]|jgi:drug/metabolite transporter (DMT)-like permease
MKGISNQLFSWIILVGLVLTWGSSFILIKKSLLYFSGVEVGLLRIGITFLFLSPLALQRIRKISRTTAIKLFFTGLIGSFIPAFMFAIAQTGINSSLAGTLNSLTPLFTLILGLLFFKQKAKWYNVVGVMIGLVGALGLINASGDMGFTFNMKYAYLIIIATLCYAFNVNFIKQYLKETDSLTITAFSFFFIGMPTFIYILIFTDIPSKIIHQSDTLTGLAYVGTLSIVGTGLALIAFNKLIKINSPLFASSVTYMIPVVALIWGVFDGETLKWWDILWFILILLGVFLVNAHPGRPLNVSSRVLLRRKK